MRLLLVLLATAGLAACGDDGDRGAPDAAPPTGPMAVDAVRYEYAIDLETRAATATVLLRVRTGGDCVTLPLRAPLAGEVTLGGAPATAAVEGEQVTVCGAGWPDGAELALVAPVTVPQMTWGASQVGYSIFEDANDARYHYLVSWVGGCDRFGPCDHAPDRFATYRFTVTHPDGMVVLCPGTIEAGATETTCTFDLPGGPTYSTFGVIASTGWEVIEAGAWSGIDVTIHNRVGSDVASMIDGDWQAGFLGFLEDRFGPYPYGDALRIVSAPTYWSGFEHPGNIVLDDGLRPFMSAYTDPANHTLAHELAHQWAGDQTTLATTYDFVWKEAMAEYLTYVWEDQTAPATAQRTAAAWKSFARGAAFHPVPEEQPPLLDYYGEVYGPGPMILFRQLEALFSREVVLDALAELLGAPRALSVADVRTALEATTGADLTGYFERWVTGAGAPQWLEVEVSTAAAGGDLDVTVAVAEGVPVAGCAFAVELRGAAAEDRVSVWFDLGVDGVAERTERVTPAPAFAIVETALDPGAHCLVYAPGASVAPRHPPGWSPWRSY